MGELLYVCLQVSPSLCNIYRISIYIYIYIIYISALVRKLYVLDNFMYVYTV